jgi:alkaline phosphatase D
VPRRPPSPLDRRAFLRGALATSGGVLLGCARDAAPPAPPPVGVIPALGPREPPAIPTPPLPTSAPAPAIVPSERLRPILTHGVQAGDVTSSNAMIWGRSDRLARLVVEWDLDPRFPSPRRVAGPVATGETDFCARLDLGDLPPGRRIHYRLVLENPDTPAATSAPALGSFMTSPLPSAERGDVLLAWSGDTVGQGWGINLEQGGMRIYEAMRRLAPDFFIHCGDLIYADNPILPEVTLPNGTIWKNVTTPEKSKVAETLAEFRGNFAYNLLDENVRRFNAEVPSLVMWDDHETHNNWYPSLILEDERYREKSCRVLSARGRRAMFEYTPIRPGTTEPERIYRSFHRGPMLDVFLLDERSYRGDNTENRQTVAGPDTAFLGAAQLAWLKEGLAASTATWKLIATDMPLGLVVGDPHRNGLLMQEAWANGSGPPLGRELELAELLRFAKKRRIKNLVFVTADVHYAAAHHYDPQRAEFADFDPFWEFVAGPLHASTYGPNRLDPTFGPEVRYQSPPSGKHRRGPADGAQYFGTMAIDGKSGVLTAALFDLTGTKLYSVDLPPSR